VSSTSAYRTIHYGVGAIGASIARLAAQRPDIRILGAIDADPDKAGHDLGEVAKDTPYTSIAAGRVAGQFQVVQSFSQRFFTCSFGYLLRLSRLLDPKVESETAFGPRRRPIECPRPM